MQAFAVGFRLYVQDADGKFPIVQPGWATAIYAATNVSIVGYGCPGDPHPRSSEPFQKGSVGYWFNANLSGVAKKRLTSPSTTLLLGEGDDGTDLSNATYSKTVLPSLWLTDTGKPTFRHLDGANYLFADGHILRLKPDQVTHYSGRKNAFALR